MKTLTPEQTLFESVTCNRCGGSGHFSYCQQWGTVCFGCAGSGVTLTKRGAAAKALYESLLSMPAGQLTVGQVIYIEAGPFSGAYFATITAIEADTTLYNNELRTDSIDISTESKDGRKMSRCTSKDTVIRIGATAEQKFLAKVRALGYQDTLTKQGKECKRKVAR